MRDLYLEIAIMDRAKLPDLISLYRDNQVEVNWIALGRGTATGQTLEYFGLERSEKAVCFTVMTGTVWKHIKRGLRYKIRIDVPGTGIAFTVPMSSIGGRRELAYLTENQNFEIGKEIQMNDTDHELLVAICNQGYNEVVMDAARDAGAGGGTVIHARGTGMKNAEKFLGISLASEKEIVFLVVKTGEKKKIMEAIMRRAGMEEKAKTIVFSLPVTDTAGLRIIEEEPEGDPEENVGVEREKE